MGAKKLWDDAVLDQSSLGQPSFTSGGLGAAPQAQDFGFCRASLDHKTGTR